MNEPHICEMIVFGISTAVDGVLDHFKHAHTRGVRTKDKQYGLYFIVIQYKQTKLYWYWLYFHYIAIPIPELYKIKIWRLIKRSKKKITSDNIVYT